MNRPQHRESWRAEGAKGQDAGARSKKLPRSHQTANLIPKAENQRAPRQTQKRANQKVRERTKARERTQKKNSQAREEHQKKPQPQKKQQQHQRNRQNQKERQLSAQLPCQHGP